MPLFFFFDALVAIPPPPYYIDSFIQISDIYGVDSNNDTKIDTISMDLANPGFKTEEISNINFSMMDKDWILVDLNYSIEISPLSFVENLTLSAVANHDQISPADDIFIEFYIVSEGSNPIMTLVSDDFLWEGESSFSLRYGVSFHKVYVDPELFLEYILRIALISLGISSLIFFVYVRRFRRGG